MKQDNITDYAHALGAISSMSSIIPSDPIGSHQIVFHAPSHGRRNLHPFTHTPHSIIPVHAHRTPNNNTRNAPAHVQTHLPECRNAALLAVPWYYNTIASQRCRSGGGVSNIPSHPSHPSYASYHVGLDRQKRTSSWPCRGDEGRCGILSRTNEKVTRSLICCLS